MSQILLIAFVIFATVFGAYGSFYMKKGAAKFNSNLKEQLKNYTLILGVSLMVFSSVMFIVALRFGELSVLYPITSITYIWVVLLSMKYLNEKMNTYKWMGIFFVVLGAILVTL